MQINYGIFYWKYSMLKMLRLIESYVNYTKVCNDEGGEENSLLYAREKGESRYFDSDPLRKKRVRIRLR